MTELGNLDSAQIKLINLLLEKQLMKNKKRFERNKMIEINTIKKHAITNAIQFVKNSSLDIEKALT